MPKQNDRKRTMREMRVCDGGDGRLMDARVAAALVHVDCVGDGCVVAERIRLMLRGGVRMMRRQIGTIVNGRKWLT